MPISHLEERADCRSKEERINLREIKSVGLDSQVPCFFVPSPAIYRIRNKELILYHRRVLVSKV
jgi:hypothetical protein